ncbi:unnamed protein product [Phaedon cochleariae]|uniref:Myb/SANT-like DNA-binding domain-containing protein n=1 Tax=Phaedon cochleariae TaxID=80249 RepID=A0A9N9SJC4_PHACE|nr:unnamed protein product [Phaedon cochleariae]
MPADRTRQRYQPQQKEDIPKSQISNKKYQDDSSSKDVDNRNVSAALLQVESGRKMKEIINLVKDEGDPEASNSDGAWQKFFEKALKEGRLRQFGILGSETDDMEIIRFDHYGVAEIETSEGTSIIESQSLDMDSQSLDESRDTLLGPELTNKKTNTWSTISTKLLLGLYVENLKKVGKSANLKNKKSLWKFIREEMAEQGYLFSPKQVENRYKTLDRGYKENTLNNKKQEEIEVAVNSRSEH